MNSFLRTVLESVAIGILLAVALVGAAHAQRDGGWPVAPPALRDSTPEDELNASIGIFAWNMYHELSADRDANIFYSPYSVYQTLGMVYEGARGETAKQIAHVLKTDWDADKLGVMSADLDAILAARIQEPGGGKNEPFVFTMANALWGQKDLAFSQGFVDSLAAHFGAGLQLVDYINNTEGARETINTWVEDKTSQKIKDLLPQGVLSPATRLVLTNAIYFKAAWANPFQKGYTTQKDFHLRSGESVPVDMMRRVDHYRYYETQDMQIAILPYAGKSVSMVIILPRPGRLEDVEEQLSKNAFAAQAMLGEERRLDLQVPRFRMETMFSLSDMLQKMGMPLAFTDKADFTGMIESEALKIDDVIHKTFVDVNEQGTEAAAATAGIVSATSFQPAEEPLPFVCDRPFLFVIQDSAGFLPLFTGRVSNPAK